MKVYKLSKKTRKKMSQAKLKKPTKYWLGKKRSLEDRQKMSEIARLSGRRPPSRKGIIDTPKTREKKRRAMLGKKFPYKPHPKQAGAKHYRWKGGTSNSLDKLIRRSREYKLWRTAVFERDNYTCVWCGQKGKILNADHIKPFNLYPELRFAIDNGRTLCIDCHKTTDTYGKGAINRV